MNIIAYGSLLNLDSLEKTLGRKAVLTPITIWGFQRVFNAPFGKYSFLNLEQKKGHSIETAYFTFDEDEVQRFAEREKGSELIEVKQRYFAFVWPKKLCRELPVLMSYIQVCTKGADVLGINFWSGTKHPFIIKDDLSSPLYP